jgi:hypothetical protein
MLPPIQSLTNAYKIHILRYCFSKKSLSSQTPVNPKGKDTHGTVAKGHHFQI